MAVFERLAAATAFTGRFSRILPYGSTTYVSPLFAAQNQYHEPDSYNTATGYFVADPAVELYRVGLDSVSMVARFGVDSARIYPSVYGYPMVGSSNNLEAVPSSDAVTV